MARLDKLEKRVRRLEQLRAYEEGKKAGEGNRPDPELVKLQERVLLLEKMVAQMTRQIYLPGGAKPSGCDTGGCKSDGGSGGGQQYA